MSHKENVFRIPVFYLMHVIFLGTTAKGAWQSKKENNLMVILEGFVKPLSVQPGATLYNVLSFLTFTEPKAQRRV